MISPATDTELEAFRRDFRQDVQAFDEHLPRLLGQFRGKYVAIRHGEIVGHDTSWETLSQEMHRRYPREYVFMERVLEPRDGVIDMDSMDN